VPSHALVAAGRMIWRREQRCIQHLRLETLRCHQKMASLGENMAKKKYLAASTQGKLTIIT